MAVQKEIEMTFDYGDLAVTDGISVFDPKFDDYFYYDGDDLGVTYTPETTKFRLWAPTASESYVVLYDDWNSEATSLHAMTRDVQGTWVLTIEQDCIDKLYTYRVKVGQRWNDTVDLYARAVAVNGDRAAIIDMQRTNPQGWEQDVRPILHSHLDAIIYELHIRDLSIHPDSGIKHKGKYLGLTEAGTKSKNGVSTGLDHIAALGVTHVQLLPIYDFATESVDETKLDEPQYNWGYDPKNYNVPEGSYATNPYDPYSRIRELKQCILALHQRGLRVIMDVVYNHVYDGFLIHFTKLVPGYYLRHTKEGKFSNGSFCGNECATERAMMSKYIVDSILYWVREYHIDGFRFDLMGLLDTDTMNEVRRRLNEIDPSIMVIGEGWNMETVLPKERRANQTNAFKIPGIGHFNDRFRDSIKGDIFIIEQKGFISGEEGMETSIKSGIVGGIKYNQELRDFADEPVQSVNYVECHDNHTLWDKIMLSTPKEMMSSRIQMHRLASAIILTSQGVPFIHAGQEFLRTKQGVENSYKCPIEVNWLDWGRCAEYTDEVQYLTSLIELRKQHPAFRLKSSEEIREHLHFEEAPGHTIAYTLRNHAGGDPDQHLYVIYHANHPKTALKLPSLGEWEVRFGQEYVLALSDNIVEVHGIGMVVLGVRNS